MGFKFLDSLSRLTSHAFFRLGFRQVLHDPQRGVIAPKDLRLDACTEAATAAPCSPAGTEAGGVLSGA